MPQNKEFALVITHDPMRGEVARAHTFDEVPETLLLSLMDHCLGKDCDIAEDLQFRNVDSKHDEFL